MLPGNLHRPQDATCIDILTEFGKSPIDYLAIGIIADGVSYISPDT